MKIKRYCKKCNEEFRVKFILFESDWDKLDMKRNWCEKCFNEFEKMMEPEEVDRWDRETRMV